jgi:hypothetical protein
MDAVRCAQWSPSGHIRRWTSNSMTRDRIGRPGTARPSLASWHRELGKHARVARRGLLMQLGGRRHQSWLSVHDRWLPMLRARRGHGRRE